MPSLAKIFGFAAVALAGFVSASAPVTRDVVNAHDNLNNNNVIVNTRDCACAEPGIPSLPGIIADLKVDVKVDVDALLAIKKDTCTYEHVEPIVVNLVAKIEAATAKVLVLSKYKTEQIFFDGNVVVNVKVFAELLCSVIISICAALQVCLKLLVKLEGDVYAQLCLVGIAIARLIHCICGVVGGLYLDLVAILCVRLQVCFWVFVKLGLVDLYALLKIKVALFL